jgi:hypothetical protein
VTVPRKYLLLPRYLIEGDELFVEVDFCEDRDENLKRNIDVSLYENSNCVALSPRKSFGFIKIMFFLPFSAIDLIFIV